MQIAMTASQLCWGSRRRDKRREPIEISSCSLIPFAFAFFHKLLYTDSSNIMEVFVH